MHTSKELAVALQNGASPGAIYDQHIVGVLRIFCSPEELEEAVQYCLETKRYGTLERLIAIHHDCGRPEAQSIARQVIEGTMPTTDLYNPEGGNSNFRYKEIN